MTLEDDITRIAAMRGRPAAEYVTEAKRRSGVPAASLALVTKMSGDRRRDAEAYDELPPTSRMFIAEWPRPLNPAVWAQLLAQYDEKFLIRSFEAYWLDTTGEKAQRIVAKRKRGLS